MIRRVHIKIDSDIQAYDKISKPSVPWTIQTYGTPLFT